MHNAASLFDINFHQLIRFFFVHKLLYNLLLLPFVGLRVESMVGVKSKNCNSCAGSEIN